MSGSSVRHVTNWVTAAHRRSSCGRSKASWNSPCPMAVRIWPAGASPKAAGKSLEVQVWIVPSTRSKNAALAAAAAVTVVRPNSVTQWSQTVPPSWMAAAMAASNAAISAWTKRGSDPAWRSGLASSKTGLPAAGSLAVLARSETLNGSASVADGVAGAFSAEKGILRLTMLGRRGWVVVGLFWGGWDEKGKDVGC